MSDITAMVQAERASLATFLETLSEEQWKHPSWCHKWNVQEVVGHLVAAANVKAPRFFLALIKSGFNFDKVVENDLKQYAVGTPAEVLARFKGIVSSTRKPPGPAYVALGEVMVHGEDIRRALGADPGTHPEEHLRTLAEQYKQTKSPLKGKMRVAGLRLVASDIDWSSAPEGNEVHGPAMSLILAMVGRKGAHKDLGGPGAKTFASR